MYEVDVFVEAMIDDADGSYVAEIIRRGVSDNAVVRSAITSSILVGLSTRQALQCVVAVLLEENRTLRKGLLSRAQHQHPQPLTINGVRHEPIPGDAKP